MGLEPGYPDVCELVWNSIIGLCKQSGESAPATLPPAVAHCFHGNRQNAVALGNVMSKQYG
jgi:hypothetical protein